MADTFVFEQAAVYVDGTRFLGNLAEIEMPELAWEVMTHEAVGLRGKASYPTVMGELEATLTFADYAPELTRIVNDPFTAYNLQIRQAYGVYRAGSKIRTASVIVSLRGRFVSHSLGSLAQGEMDGKEAMMSVDYVKQTSDGQVLSEFSIDPPIYRTGGIDLFETLRSILGV
jgi:P2 family phage contractile tail tube protein